MNIAPLWGINFWPYIAAAAAAIVLLGIVMEFFGSAKLFSLRQRRQRYKFGHASALLYRRLVRPDVIKLSNGAYLAIFEMAAPDANVYEPAQLAQAEFGIAKAISQFDERMVVHMHQRHAAYSEYDLRTNAGDYPHPVLKFLDFRRAAFFRSGRTFRTRRLVSVAWLPASARAERLRAASSSGADRAIRTEDEIIEEFESAMERIEVFFRSQGTVRRLGVRRERDAFGVMRDRSEMLEHLSWCISGLERHINVPLPGQALNGLLAESFRGGFDLKVGDQETRIVVLKGLPDQTVPIVFSRLDEMKLDYSLVVRWTPLSGPEARKLLQGAFTEWTQKSNESLTMTDPHSVDMVESARQAVGFLSSGGKFGLTSVYIVLRGSNKRAVHEGAQRAVALLDEIGYKAFIATLTAEDDYFAQLPGDGYHSVRKYPINAVNAAHLFSFHEESTGRRRIGSPTLPRDTPALAYAISGYGETLYHVNVNDEPRDLFHYFGVGGTGSGKSLSLAVLAASWVARVPYAGFTGIDRGRSLYRLTRFLDGNFYDVLGDRDSPGFALFSEVDDPQISRELLDLLEGFIELQGVAVTPTRRRALEEAMNRVRELPQSLRSLKAYNEMVQDPEGVLRPALSIYTRNGVLGSTLDCEVDSFSTGLFNVVEIGRIFSMSPKLLIPVLSIVFWKSRTQVRRLKESTGNFDYHWLYQIDEAHTLLGHPLGQKFIQDMLKMGRKEKMAVGMWSNAAADFAKSDILNDIQEACRTRFFFRNTDVLDDEKVRGMYSDLGLPRQGIELLPGVAQFSLLLQQPASRELQEIRWNLDRAWLAIVGRSRDADNRRVDDFMERYPSTWREELLRFEGVDDRVISDLVSDIKEAKKASTDESLALVSRQRAVTGK